MRVRHVIALLFASLSSMIAAREVTTFAGTGEAGYSGDGGPAVEARLNQPFGVVKASDGSVYICDTFNHCIRKVTTDGIITTVASDGEAGYAGDGGLAIKARLNQPYEVRIASNGDIFFVEMINCVIRKVDAVTGVISTVAGTGNGGYSGDGGPAVKAEFRSPHSIQFGPEGLLYVCDIGNQRIRTVDIATGVARHFAGSGRGGQLADGMSFAQAPLHGPRAIDFDADGTLLLALREGNVVLALDRQTGTLRHLAGNGEMGFTGNGGPAQEARLSGPKGIAAGPDGGIYLMDTESHSVRMIDPDSGTLELIVGTGEAGDGPDGDPLKCRLNRPHGIFVDQDGAIFMGDTLSHRIRVARVER